MRKYLFTIILLIFVFFPFFMKEKNNFQVNLVNESNSTLYEVLGYSKEDELLLKKTFTETELEFLLTNQITKTTLFPYLPYKSFEIVHIEEYELIRKTNQSSHVYAINSINHPYMTKDFYQHVQPAINLHTNLLLVNKNYHLSEDFIPKELVLIDELKTVVPGNHQRNYLNKDAYNALKDLFQNAKKEGLSLYVSSGYRSYQTQETIHRYYEKHRENPDNISARPGHSEHQTGLAVDITCKDVNYRLINEFENTKEGQFIKEYAYKYGFIIRYIKNKEHITGYIYEPWHLRYVGKEIAKKITQENITLEEYLLNYTEL